MRSGPAKVAALLLTLDRVTAAELLRRLPEEDRRAVTRALANLPEGAFGREVQESLLREFQTSLAVDEPGEPEPETVERLLADALGPEAQEAAQPLVLKRRLERARGRLLRLDPASVAFVLAGEHPQAIAVVLFELGPDAAAKVLPGLHPLVQQDVVERMVVMERPARDLVVAVAEAAVRKAGRLEALPAGGSEEEKLKTVATMLNRFAEEAQQHLLMNLEFKDPERVQKLKDQLFTFEDLIKLGPREIQRVLSGIDTKVLAMALKGASPQLSEFLNANVSKRTQERVNEERETMGAVRLSEVRQAQQEMATVARDLIQRGEIQYGGRDELVQ